MAIISLIANILQAAFQFLGIVLIVYYHRVLNKNAMKKFSQDRASDNQAESGSFSYDVTSKEILIVP